MWVFGWTRGLFEAFECESIYIYIYIYIYIQGPPCSWRRPWSASSGRSSCAWRGERHDMLYRCMSYVTWHVFFLYILPYALLCTLRTLCTLYSALQIICSILSAPYFIFYTVFYIICVYHIHYIFCVLRQCNNTMLCYTALHCATLHYSTLCYIIL